LRSLLSFPWTNWLNNSEPDKEDDLSIKVKKCMVSKTWWRKYVLSQIFKIRKSKKETQPGEKPKPVRTHQRNTIVVPEMVGSIVGVYNGK
jgi:small subunit ribosomal protein S15e